MSWMSLMTNIHKMRKAVRPNVNEKNGRRGDFKSRMDTIKSELKSSVKFYPFGILNNLDHLDLLLSDVGLFAEDVLTSNSVNDIGGADGDLAFYCKDLGAEHVNLIDNAPTNYNGLEGARKLKAALGADVNILEADIDSIDAWKQVPISM